MTFSLSPDQQAAVDRITNWFFTVRRNVTFCKGEDADGDEGVGNCSQTPHTHVDEELGSGPAISLGGLAGTGKTSIMRHLGELLVDKGVKLLYATPTNKAAGVLRKKLSVDMRALVSTTYAISYFPDPKDKCKNSGQFVAEIETECVCGQEKADCTCPRIFEPCGQHEGSCTIYEHLEWIKRPYVRGHAELLIIDEASMLSQEQMEDLLSFGLPCVIVGDHGQLPPVMATMNRWIATPDILLTENHRQKNDTSGIVDLALWARQGIQLRKGVWGDGRTVVLGKDDSRIARLMDPQRFSGREIGAWPQIICALNRDRAGLNRIFHGAGSVRAGDKVIALKKCVVPVVERIDPEGRPVPMMRPVRAVDEHGVVVESGEVEEVKRTVHNGTMGIVVKAWEPKGGLVRIVVRLEDPDVLVEVSGCEEKQFGAEGVLGKNQVVSRESRLWDYAYAVTAHKAQGSEWDEVIVMDNSGSDKERWRYTAITRAKRKLIVISMRE